MRRVVLEAPGRLGVEEVDRPLPGPSEVEIRIGQVGICGSDIHLYRSGALGPSRADGPFVLGHECMGEVVAIPDSADPALLGSRVIVEPALHCGRCRWCREGKTNVCPHGEFLGLPPRAGALQEYLAHPVEALKRLPEGVSDETAVMLEPLAIALRAIDQVGPQEGQTVVVLGTGVLGTCVFELLRIRHGLEIICVDLLQPRLQRVAERGAARVVLAQAGAGARDEMVREIQAATRGEGADVVFECAGARDTLWAMCEIAAPGGRVAVIGSNPEDEVRFSSSSARRKGLRIQFIRRSLGTLDRCLRLVQDGAIASEELVTHRFEASRAAAAFHMVDKYEDGVLKAVIDMRAW